MSRARLNCYPLSKLIRRVEWDPDNLRHRAETVPVLKDCHAHRTICDQIHHLHLLNFLSAVGAVLDNLDPDPPS